MNQGWSELPQVLDCALCISSQSEATDLPAADLEFVENSSDPMVICSQKVIIVKRILLQCRALF